MRCFFFLFPGDFEPSLLLKRRRLFIAIVNLLPARAAFMTGNAGYLNRLASGDLAVKV